MEYFKKIHTRSSYSELPAIKELPEKKENQDDAWR
jgi:hypothetical protein